jgi:uncharacterized protein
MIAIVPNLGGVTYKRLHRTATFCFCALVLAAGTGCAAWQDKQRMWTLRPTLGKPQGFSGFGAHAVVTRAAASEIGHEVQLWWLPDADPLAPTLLYLHGTFRNLYQNAPKIAALRAAGFSVVAVEYRGWGDSTPIVPSETSIYADAQIGWAELVRRQSDPRKRLIYGHSMGGAVAIELASQRHHPTDYGALLVESSFTRWPDVAAVRGLLGTMVSWLAVDEFDSIDKIKRVDAPLWLVHGTLDNTVDVRLGRRLRDAAPAGVRYLEIEGGSHSRLFSDAPGPYQKMLGEVRAQLMGWGADPKEK